MRNTLIQRFFQLESASSLLLLSMALLALIWANSPWAFLHQSFIHYSLFWINDILMAVFFLLVGLELKRGYLEGRFSKLTHVFATGIAAFGGMLMPALIYIAINYHHPNTLRGWATPVATDIAFAIGTLSFFGRRVPISLKLFLLALAIFDDIGALIIIAVFYAGQIAWLWLGLSMAMVFFLFILTSRMRLVWPFLLLGAILWLSLYRAGLHPVLSGFIVALAIPSHMPDYAPLSVLENRLHPWVAYVIMPLFALANAGFTFSGLTMNSLLSPIVLGIVFGLFIGKQIGIFGFTYVTMKMRLMKWPERPSWLALYGVSILCGIGFTMSLFLGTLSFPNENIHLAEVRLGVIMGSVLSGLVGGAILAFAFKKKKLVVKGEEVDK